MKRSLFAAVVMILLCNTFVFGQELNSSSENANRRTALRFLSLAQNYASEANWNVVISEAQMGLDYDDEISDLWYLLAIAKQKCQYKKAEIISDVETAINNNQWVNYNRDNARILYADMLCDTLRYNDVFKVLDEAPFVYSSDAEYIRIKAYYRIGGKQQLDIARNKIDAARRIYPDDTRFPLLFFKYEDWQSQDSEVKRLSNIFIKQIKQYASVSPDKNEELTIYSAFFANPDDRKIILKSFKARGLKHPLYASLAIDEGLMTQSQGLEYIKSFSDDKIEYNALNLFISRITEKSTIKNTREYFSSYSGTILFDVNGDGIDNLEVKYAMGRPSKIKYDYNQDDYIDFEINCDYGAPLICQDFDNNLVYEWGTYPYISSVKAKDLGVVKNIDYTLVPDVLSYSPVKIIAKNSITDLTGIDFFIVEINDSKTGITNDELLLAASSIIVPSQERNNSFIKFNLIDGFVVSSEYYADDGLYAKCQFTDGYPMYRSIDNDKDGMFETTEIYALDEQLSYNVQTFEEEQIIMANLFGIKSNFSNCYLRMVQIDQNGNSIPDYTEEYLPDGGKICSWDTDDDNEWNLKFIKFPYEENGDLKEECMFYGPLDGELMIINYLNGAAVSLKIENDVIPIYYDDICDIYWIGNPGAEQIAKKVKEEVELSRIKNVCTIIENEGIRVMAVNMQGILYAKIVTPSLDEEKNSEN